MADCADKPDRQLALEALNVHKRFGGVRALRGANLTVRAGEFHGLVGANGAGKSTLAKIIAGVLRPDSATIRVFGRPASITSPSAAEALGIGLVPQEPALALNLPIVDNLVLGRERTTPWGTLRRRDELNFATQLLARVGLDEVHPLTPVEELTAAQRQLVQIARALGVQARILILDEPTSAITAHEADRLFALTKQLQKQGTSIIYVSHRLEEIFQLCDRVTVMRDGLTVAVFDVARTTPEQVITAMAGEAGRHAITAEGLRETAVRDEPPILEVRSLTRSPAFYDISFSVRPGEVLGIAGLVGSGRSELLRAVAGIDTPDSGQVIYAGRPVRWKSPAHAIASGVVLLPEDRHLQGLVLQMAIAANISLPILYRLVRLFWLMVGAERSIAAAMIQRFGIVCRDADQPVAELSGGNQQKVLVARTVACRPRVVLLDEPTRGVDVAAKADIHRWIRELAREGVAVVLVSSELQEVAALADRIVVLRDGRMVGEVPGPEATEESLLAMAAGAA